MNPWSVLILAGLLEIGWPVGFKLAHNTEYRVVSLAFAILCMILSGWLLFLAQKSIPIGTAYAVWTGIGAIGTFFAGVLFFQDAFHWMRLLGIAMIAGGIWVLKSAA